MWQHPRLYSGYTKTSTREDSMILVTINNVWLKCYLKVCIIHNSVFTNLHIVADKMRSLQSLALALTDLYLVFEKNLKNNYSFLSDIFGSLFSTLTTHANLSLSVSSIIPTISEGIVVLNDFERGFCRIIFDSTSNNFILSYLSFVINIFVNILYIFYPQSIK